MDASTAVYVPRRAVRFEKVLLRGVAHRIARWGAADADPIVLLHGFLDCSETFQFLVDELPADWSFVALDWRGFGESTANGRPYWFPDYLADLEALFDALAPRRALRLVGHSMGGNVASLYAGVRPARVRAVVSLEGFGLPRTGSSAAPQRYAQWLDELRTVPARNTYDSVAQLGGILQRRNSRLTAARAAFIAAAWTRPLVDGRVELRGDPWHRLANPQLYRREEAEACWRAYPGPVQVVLAEHSEYLQKLGEDAEPAAFERAFQQLELVTIPGVGHMMHHENPALVAATIGPFLGRHA